MNFPYVALARHGTLHAVAASFEEMAEALVDKRLRHWSRTLGRAMQDSVSSSSKTKSTYTGAAAAGAASDDTLFLVRTTCRC